MNVSKKYFRRKFLGFELSANARGRDGPHCCHAHTLGYDSMFCSQAHASLYPERSEDASKSVDVVGMSRYPRIVESQHLCTRSRLHVLEGIDWLIYRVDLVFSGKLMHLLAYHFSIPHVFCAILQQNQTRYTFECVLHLIK